MAAIDDSTCLPLRPLACQPGALSFLGSTFAPFSWLSTLDHAVERFVDHGDVVSNAPAYANKGNRSLSSAVIAQKLH